jgi:hypothetical protein
MSAAKHQFLIDNGLLDPVTGVRPTKVVTVEEAVEYARSDADAKEVEVDLSWLLGNEKLDLSGLVDDKGEPLFVDLSGDGKYDAVSGGEIIDAVADANVVEAAAVDPSQEAPQ